MAFSVMIWIRALLPSIAGVAWTPSWPTDFAGLPRGCFREAGDSTALVTTEGEGSADVSVYIDTWAATPELRETYKGQIKDALATCGMVRGMSRDVEEDRPDGTKAFRSTLLYSGEIDHDSGRMCVPG